MHGACQPNLQEANYFVKRFSKSLRHFSRCFPDYPKTVVGYRIPVFYGGDIDIEYEPGAGLMFLSFTEEEKEFVQLIADSLESKTITLTPEELGNVWDAIEKHIKLEKKTVEYANEAKEALKGKKMVVQEYLIDYLLIDEEKHNKILESLATIKKGMYPYA